MKKIAIALIFALTLSLVACTAKKENKEEAPDVDNTVVEQQETDSTETEEIQQESEVPEMPWIDEPVETPILPILPDEADTSDENNNETDSTAEQPALREDFSNADIVPDDNELPPIPIN